MTTSQKILDLIGEDAMSRLCQEFGGRRIHVPREVPNPARNTDIIITFSESLKAGNSTMNSYFQCADEYNLSVRTIQKIVATS